MNRVSFKRLFNGIGYATVKLKLTSSSDYDMITVDSQCHLPSICIPQPVPPDHNAINISATQGTDQRRAQEFLAGGGRVEIFLEFISIGINIKMKYILQNTTKCCKILVLKNIC